MQSSMLFVLVTIATIVQLAFMIPQLKPTTHEDLANAAYVSKAVDRLTSMDDNKTTVMDCDSIF